jgi:hypothetical protein
VRPRTLSCTAEAPHSMRLGRAHSVGDAGADRMQVAQRRRWTLSRNSRPPVKAVSDVEVRVLLDRFRCPVPFHAVRTRFLGDIASPVMSAWPLDAVKALWGGELPEFDSLDAVNELLRILVMGLWNRLSRHQERSAPFRLVRIEIPETGEGLAHIASSAERSWTGLSRGCSEKSKASNFRSVPIAPSTRFQSYARYSTASTSSPLIRQSP